MSDSGRPEGTEILGFKKLDFIVWSVLGSAFLTFALAGIFQSKYPYTEKYAKAAHYQAQCNKSAAAGYVPIDSDIVAAEDSKKTASTDHKADKEPEYPDYCDLAAQYRAATAAEYNTISSIATAIFTFFGMIFLWMTLIYTKGTLRAANDTNKTTQEIGRAQTRAHLFIESAEISAPKGGDIWPITNGATSVVISLKIRNLGNTVATNISLSGAFSVNTDESVFDLPIEPPLAPMPWVHPRMDEASPIMLVATKEGDQSVSINSGTSLVLCIAYKFEDIFGEEITHEIAFAGLLHELEFNDGRLAALRAVISDGIPKLASKESKR